MYIKMFLKLSMLADDTTTTGREFHSHMVARWKIECRMASLLLCSKEGQFNMSAY